MQAYTESSDPFTKGRTLGFLLGTINPKLGNVQGLLEISFYWVPYTVLCKYI